MSYYTLCKHTNSWVLPLEDVPLIPSELSSYYSF